MPRLAHALLPPAAPVAESQSRTVLVIGAGIIGVCTALWLLRLGHKVKIVDYQPPAKDNSYELACSYGNACSIAHHACIPVATPGIAFKVPGMLLDPNGPLTIRWQHLLRIAPWIFDFLRASSASEVERIATTLSALLRFADDAYAPLIADSDTGKLLRHTGCLYLYRSERAFEACRGEMALRARHHVSMDVLSPEQVRQLEPKLQPLYARGVLFNDAYSIDSPHKFVLGLAAAIRSRGGEFIQGEAGNIVSKERGVEVDVNGKTHSAERVIVAGGAWSRQLTRALRERIPLDAERGYHVFFSQAGGLLSRPVCYPQHGFYMTPVDGGIRAAGTVEFGSFERRINAARTRKIAAVANTLLPDLGPVASEWLGFRPSMPDSLPVIGPSLHDPRIIHAFGHGHIGMTLGGITGRIVADLVSDRAPPLDLTPLRADRFA